MTTDITEKGLEDLIVSAMTGQPCDPVAEPDSVRLQRPAYGGTGWICGYPQDYDREYAADLVQLSTFLEATQPEQTKALDLGADSPARRKFLARLQGEITKRGTIDVLRVTLWQSNVTLRTASASPASFVTAVTRPNWPLIWVFSSMACRYLHSS
jgi:type I restriction enzyme R subunit